MEKGTIPMSKTYEKQIRALEKKGMTTSDAQAVLDARNLGKNNSRLAEAAPDMLDALRYIATVLRTEFPEALALEIENLDAVIKKATGGGR